MLLEMLRGVNCFDADHFPDVAHKILTVEPSYPRRYVSEAAETLLRGLIERNPNKRYDYEQIRAASWFSHLSWQDLMVKKSKSPFHVRGEDNFEQLDIDMEEVTGKSTRGPPKEASQRKSGKKKKSKRNAAAVAGDGGDGAAADALHREASDAAFKQVEYQAPQILVNPKDKDIKSTGRERAISKRKSKRENKKK